MTRRNSAGSRNKPTVEVVTAFLCAAWPPVMIVTLLHVILFLSALAFLAALYSQPDGPALAQLLTHLPLLNPGNTEAREHYMKLMPKVLLGSSEDLEYLEQCRQLLSLALVHPAFPLDNREALSYWLARLDEKQKNITDRKHSMNGHLSAVPPPIPPRRIYQIPSKTEEGGGSSRMGGPSSLDSGRIYIKTSSGWAGQSDSLCNGFPVDPDMFEGGDDETPYNRERASTLGHHYGAPPTGDEYSSRQARCNTLPARPGHCDELPNQIEWKAGMKGWCEGVCVHECGLCVGLWLSYTCIHTILIYISCLLYKLFDFKRLSHLLY